MLIVDALLPRVVQFLSRYPNWLDILVQCARKTEVCCSIFSQSLTLTPLQVAKWPYLFSIAGNVRDLFEVRMFLLRWAHTLADLCVEFHVLNGRILLDGYAKSRVGR